MNNKKLTVTVKDGIGRLDGYLTTIEYAEQIGCAEVTVRQWIYRGKLDGIQIGKSWWIKEGTPAPPRICNMKIEDQIAYKRQKRDKLNPNYFHFIPES